MAIVGFSKPKFARYKAVGSTVTYSGGGSAGRGISANLEIESSEDNNLYCDNVIGETDRQFTGGTFTVGTDDLSQLVSAASSLATLRMYSLPFLNWMVAIRRAPPTPTRSGKSRCPPRTARS